MMLLLYRKLNEEVEGVKVYVSEQVTQLRSILIDTNKKDVDSDEHLERKASESVEVSDSNKKDVDGDELLEIKASQSVEVSNSELILLVLFVVYCESYLTWMVYTTDK